MATMPFILRPSLTCFLDFDCVHQNVLLPGLQQSQDISNSLASVSSINITKVGRLDAQTELESGQTKHYSNGSGRNIQS